MNNNDKNSQFYFFIGCFYLLLSICIVSYLIIPYIVLFLKK